MIDTQQETKLRAYGFTENNIATMRTVLEQPRRKDRTLHSLLRELKRRFYVACIITFESLLIISYAIITNEYGHGLVYFAVFIVFFFYIGDNSHATGLESSEIFT